MWRPCFVNLEIENLPIINAALNVVAFALLVAGYASIRSGKVRAHRACMTAAFAVSVLFLAGYLTYRFLGEEKRFTGQGWIRPVYFFVLISHVVLAPTVPLLAGRSIYLAVRGRFDQHKRLVRITFPIWIYVSVTGVLVYLLLFILYGGPIAAPTRLQ